MVAASPAGLLLLVGLSFGICVLATSLAVESTALFLPAFMLIFPVIVPGFPALSGNEAIGLTLIVMFFGQSSTLAGYWYRGRIEWRLAGPILLLTLPLAVVGRALGYLLPERLILLAFAGLLLLLAGLVATAQARPSDRTATGPTVDPSSDPGGPFDGLDRAAFAGGGLFAGLVGFAIGEITNTALHVRHGLPIGRSTGTSTLVLYLTLLAANVTNLLIVFLAPATIVGSVGLPWALATVIAPVVVVGGQVGAFLNDRLPERILVRLLVTTYLLVGVLTLLRVVR